MFGGKGFENWKIGRFGLEVGKWKGWKVRKLESEPTSLFKIQRWTFIVFEPPKY